MKRAIFTFGMAIGFGLLVAPATAQTLKKVKDRGSLICGVSQGLPGFSNPDDKGAWTGLDVDFCRAIAAAVFNDPAKVKFTPLSSKDRFEPLKTGEIDVLFAQHDLDAVARRPVQFRRRQLLRRPGLYCAQGAQGQLGASSSTALRSACRPGRRPSSTSATISVPTACATRSLLSRPPTRP